jgi:hypothetical protein
LLLGAPVMEEYNPKLLLSAERLLNVRVRPGLFTPK